MCAAHITSLKGTLTLKSSFSLFGFADGYKLLFPVISHGLTVMLSCLVNAPLYATSIGVTDISCCAIINSGLYWP